MTWGEDEKKEESPGKRRIRERKEMDSGGRKERIGVIRSEDDTKEDEKEGGKPWQRRKNERKGLHRRKGRKETIEEMEKQRRGRKRGGEEARK